MSKKFTNTRLGIVIHYCKEAKPFFQRTDSWNLYFMSFVVRRSSIGITSGAYGIYVVRTMDYTRT